MSPAHPAAVFPQVGWTRCDSKMWSSSKKSSE
jgi:hypothetical protein